MVRFKRGSNTQFTVNPSDYFDTSFPLLSSRLKHFRKNIVMLVNMKESICLHVYKISTNYGSLNGVKEWFFTENARMKKNPTAASIWKFVNVVLVGIIIALIRSA